MSDRPGDALRRYHEQTKHSVERLRADRHTLDWENQPVPYKLYTDLEPLPLPRDWPSSTVAALEAIAAPATVPDAAAGSPTGPGDDASVVPTLTTLARLLHFSAGIVRKSVYASGREMYFRAAACTGALYHIDVYLCCDALPDLPAGVYHFGPHDFALRRLRAGDHRAAVIAASGVQPALARAPVVLAYVSTFWRNAWKYRARTYRHCFWDTGTMLANALAIANADRLPVRVVLGFVDAALHHLLALDGEREAPLALLALGRVAAPPSHAAPPAPTLTPRTAPLSAHEITYPEIIAAHAASSLGSPADVAGWRMRPLPESTPPPTGARIALPTVAPPATPTIDEVIRRRGSARAFARTAIGLDALSLMLARSTRGIPTDLPLSSSGHLGAMYLVVNAVDGLASGTYVYDRDAHELVLLRTGDFRREAGFLALGQDLAADASINVYALSDLATVVATLGDRGYRAAQLAAAIIGGKLYLAAYALRLGATGLTFLDDAVTEFLSPHAAGKSVMFLTAIGRPRGRHRGDET